LISEVTMSVTHLTTAECHQMVKQMDEKWNIGGSIAEIVVTLARRKIQSNTARGENGKSVVAVSWTSESRRCGSISPHICVSDLRRDIGESVEEN
jgi:ribosomal protein L7/L12